MTDQSKRNVDLDIVKGLLVILMLFYHCASVTLLKPAFQEFAVTITQKLNFIAPAFLFISGLLCGIHYLPQLKQKPNKTRRRLAIRGLKLIMIFLGSNVIFYSLISLVDFSLDKLIDFFKIYQVINLFYGFLPGDFFAYTILYYIGFLLLSTSFLLGRINFIYPLSIIFIINYLPISVIWGLTYGFIGVLTGSLWGNNKLTYSWYFFNKLRGIPLILLFFTYLLFFQGFHWPFESHIVFIRTFAYCFKGFVWLLSLYFMLSILNIKSLTNAIILFGQYTLLSYMAQMIIIRINFIILSEFVKSFYYIYFINILISFIILYALVFLIDYFQKQNAIIIFNKTYKIIFN